MRCVWQACRRLWTAATARVRVDSHEPYVDSVTNTKPSQLVVVSSQADKRALGVLSDSYQWTCPSIESLLNRALPPDPPGTSHLL